MGEDYVSKFNFDVVVGSILVRTERVFPSTKSYGQVSKQDDLGGVGGFENEDWIHVRA